MPSPPTKTPVLPPPPGAECPACGSLAIPRYTLLSGSEVCYLCPDCGLEFDVLDPGRRNRPDEKSPQPLSLGPFPLSANPTAATPGGSTNSRTAQDQTT